MAVLAPENIRNIVLVGNGGSGKTTLTERLLFAAGATKRMGSVEEKNTVSDWTDEEKHHLHSLRPSVMHFAHGGKHVNLIDTPGLADFIGHAIACFPACESVLVVVDAARGVETNMRRLMAVAAERNLPRVIVVNKIDDQKANLPALVRQIQDSFGSVCLPINLPAKDGAAVEDVFDHASGETDFSSVAEAHTRILEQVIEVDEDLMAEYLDKGADGLDKHKIHEAFERALREAHLVPICFLSAKTGAGCQEFMDIIMNLLPSPLEGNPRTFLKKQADGAEQKVHFKPDPALPAVAHVFQVTTDPFVGKLGVFKVHQGAVRTKAELFVNDDKKAVRLGHLFRLQGKDHVEVDAIGAGDIGVVAKVDEIGFNAVLHADHDSDGIRLSPLPLPKPMFGLAVELKNHKDESKFAPAVQKLAQEDPCFVFERIAATKQSVIRGLGELHLRVVLEKLKHAFNIDVATAPPKVAYKETISSKGDGHHRHKKQSGGSGEFGEVYLRVAPLPRDHAEGFEFENATVGGSIPKQFLPAVEKGVRQVLAEGAIAGYPMTGIKVEVYDGKYHAVDSKEVAFVKAGRRAFVDAVQKARPTLLEPFVMLEVTVPSNMLGDIAGDLSTKRGRVQDTQMIGSDTVVVRAVAPLGELQNYSNQLKSMTGGAGSFSMDYSHDEQTPAHIQQEVVAAYKPHGDED